MPSDRLRLEQSVTLTAPRLRYGILARALFITLDLFYGRRRTLSKFKVLEVIARVPYQAWEQVAYVAMTHKEESLSRIAQPRFSAPGSSVIIGK